MESILEGDRRIKVAGMSEMLVKRRLSVLKELVCELGLTISVVYVPSGKNKADALTRVNKKWLKRESNEPILCRENEAAAACAVSVESLHQDHHFGVERTLQLAKLVRKNVTRKEVEQCVKECVQCKEVDPPPVRHEVGSLSVDKNWIRLAVDTTHYQGYHYLTIVDCGPSRFAIWRKVSSENSSDVVANLEEVFRERGPPTEILVDNSRAFRSSQLGSACQKWGVRRRFRAAYRPSGNGIVERNHRTVKRTAARTGGSPLDAVFYYNLASQGKSSPSASLHKYEWRHPRSDPIQLEDASQCTYQVGQAVLVKPANVRCTSRWLHGRVTGIISANTIEIDNVPRHILDVRPVNEASPQVNEHSSTGGGNMSRRTFSDDSDEESECSAFGENSEVIQDEVPRRSNRIRRSPVWLRDYEH